MGLNAIAFFIVCSVICESLGDIQLSCNTVDPMLPSKIKCTCRNTNGEGIQWYKNNVFMADCYLETEICMFHNGHSFVVNSSEREYIIEKGGYNYSSCNMYTCRDLQQPEKNASMRIAVQNSTSISALNISEPTTNHTSGFIGVTTECIYGASSEVTDLDIQWLVVMGSVEKSLNPMKTTIKTHNGSCQLCDGDKATQFIIGFYHKEEMGCQQKEAKFRIILRHNNISSEPLNITTRNFYCVSDQTTDGSTSRRSTNTTILIVIFDCLLLQYIVLVFMCIYKRRKRNTNPTGDESSFSVVRRNPGMKGNCDTNVEMDGLVATDNKEGKMRSDSTKLKRLQYWFLLLAFVPALGIIGIIAYLYTYCSGTDTERTSLSDQTADGSTSMRSIIRTIKIVCGCLLLQYIVVLVLRYIHRKRNTNHPPGDESSCFLVRRNPGMKGNCDTSIEMKDFIATDNKEGKMKSDSTKLIQLQDWFLLLAHVPVLGIIGIIAYLYTCCSGTGTEGKSAKGDVIMTVTPLENFVNTRAVQMKLRQPHKGDQTEHKGSDEGYKRTSSTSSSEESQ